MVTRVWGKADDIEIMLEKGEDGRWTGLIPWSDDGEYVIELYAEDLAGNIGYYCTMLFAISGHELKCYRVPRGYISEARKCCFVSSADKKKFFAIVENRKFHTAMKGKEYFSEIRKGGYTIVRSVCSADAHGPRGSDSC